MLQLTLKGQSPVRITVRKQDIVEEGAEPCFDRPIRAPYTPLLYHTGITLPMTCVSDKP